MQFDLICANLPYIPTNTLQGLDVLEHEPRVALDGGESGLKLIEELLNQAQTRLKPWGTILLEIEATLGKQVLALAQSTFSKAQVNLHQDLAGKDRLVEIRQP
jgi:release factor glutamine methyltransferase